jgi:hypothetical protein
MPHHHHRYIDWWYEDLPEGCKKAATALGYDSKDSWDGDHPVPFDTKPFNELTLSEKRAAFHLGINVIDKKLDSICWEQTDAGKHSWLQCTSRSRGRGRGECECECE